MGQGAPTRGESGRAGGLSAKFVLRARSEPCFRILDIHLLNHLSSTILVTMLDPKQFLDRVMGAWAFQARQRQKPALGEKLHSATPEAPVCPTRSRAGPQVEPELARLIEEPVQAAAYG